MPEHGNNKEKLIGEVTSDSQERLAIESVRFQLNEHARQLKGLPGEPLQLDAQAVSQLLNVKIIDSGQEPEVPENIIDISGVTVKDSPFGDILFKERQKKRAA